MGSEKRDRNSPGERSPRLIHKKNSCNTNKLNILSQQSLNGFGVLSQKRFNRWWKYFANTPEQKKKTGRPGKISREDQILMTLEYWREYRTYFHIGQSWGVTESTACRIIRKFEKILSQARVFTLPGKKRLYQTDSAIDVVVIDVTETPIQRFLG